MKKENIPKIDKKADGLSSDELNLLKDRFDDLEDRSQIPPPNKKPNKILVFAKKNVVATAIISVLILSVVAVLVLASIYIVKNFMLNNTSDYVFIFETFGKKNEEVEYDYDSIVINDVLYVDMNKLAEFSGMSVSGTAETRKFISSDEHYMKFINNSEYAIINATKVKISPSAIVEEGRCLVPYRVIKNAISSGISFETAKYKNIVTIKRNNYMVDEIVYNEKITFSASAFDAIAAISDTSNVTFDYNSDISAYIDYICPTDNTPYLLLVNDSNLLESTYIPANMQQIPARYTTVGDKTYFLVDAAKYALEAMLNDMEKDVERSGIYVTSAYRSYEYQLALFESYVKSYTDKGLSRESAEAETLKFSARPGTSEHQTGLCIDFMTTSMTTLNNDFENTRAFNWLSENAYKYGFILRYPKNTSATSHDYESWHYRFVGRDAATEMYFSNLCLEEYIEII